jgi:hypothetical protein
MIYWDADEGKVALEGNYLELLHKFMNSMTATIAAAAVAFDAPWKGRLTDVVLPAVGNAKLASVVGRLWPRPAHLVAFCGSVASLIGLALHNVRPTAGMFIHIPDDVVGEIGPFCYDNEPFVENPDVTKHFVTLSLRTSQQRAVDLHITVGPATDYGPDPEVTARLLYRTTFIGQVLVSKLRTLHIFLPHNSPLMYGSALAKELDTLTSWGLASPWWVALADQVAHMGPAKKIPEAVRPHSPPEEPEAALAQVTADQRRQYQLIEARLGDEIGEDFLSIYPQLAAQIRHLAPVPGFYEAAEAPARPPPAPAPGPNRRPFDFLGPDDMLDG